MGHVCLNIWKTYVKIMLNQSNHMSEKSGKLGQAGKCQENKYVPHIHANVIHIHVRHKIAT